MTTVLEIVERALKSINDLDWEFHEALAMKLAAEIAPRYEKSTERPDK